MWGKKAVLKAPFCFICPETDRAIKECWLKNFITTKAFFFFFGVFSLLEAPCTGSKASERKPMREALGMWGMASKMVS